MAERHIQELERGHNAPVPPWPEVLALSCRGLTAKGWDSNLAIC